MLHLVKASKSSFVDDGILQIRELCGVKTPGFAARLTRNNAPATRVVPPDACRFIYVLNSACHIVVDGRPNTLIPGDCLHFADSCDVQESRDADCLTLEVHASANGQAGEVFKAQDIGYLPHERNNWMARRPLSEPVRPEHFVVQLSRVTAAPDLPAIPWPEVPFMWFGLQGFAALELDGRNVFLLPGDALSSDSLSDDAEQGVFTAVSMNDCSDDFEVLEIHLRG